MSLLSIKGLNQSYGGSHTLWDIDLDVQPGSRMCLMGRNGMGKTTLMKTLIGLVPAIGGTITFAGADITRERLRRAAEALGSEEGFRAWRLVSPGRAGSRSETPPR